MLTSRESLNKLRAIACQTMSGELLRAPNPTGNSGDSGVSPL
jgi:hypothetical protein